MVKRKLLMILGAGSSLDQGMPSTASIGDRMQAWSAEWFRSDPAIPPVDNYFTKLWNNAETYCASRWESLDIRPNFERVLGEMAALAHWMEPAPLGNALRPFVCGDQPPAGLRYQFDRHEAPYGAYHGINGQLSYLMQRLAKYIRYCCLQRELGSRPFSAYRRLVTELRDAFDLGIYNLNYDNIAVTAWPEAFTGFNESGRFDPLGVQSRPEWGFIYHLHGSVHHTISGPFVDAIQWQQDLHATFKDGDEGQATNMMSDRKSFPRSTLIAGGFKLDQLLIEPFHSFYAALIRHVYEADAILIGGYGFGDAHVNHALRNCLQRRHVQRPPDPVPVMILEKTDGGWAMDSRQDLWSREMRYTLCANSFRCEMLHEPTPNAFTNRIPSQSFEFSDIHRVGVWHGGFCGAASQSSRVIDFFRTRDMGTLC